MNVNNVTLQDCLDMMEKKGEYAVINDGSLAGFVKEKDTETDQQSERYLSKKVAGVKLPLCLF